MVQVLPVPALASSSVVPVGSGSRMSKRAVDVTQVPHLLRAAEQRLPEPDGELRRAGAAPRSTARRSAEACSRHVDGRAPRRTPGRARVGVLALDAVRREAVGLPLLPGRLEPGSRRCRAATAAPPRRTRTRSSPASAAARACRGRRGPRGRAATARPGGRAGRPSRARCSGRAGRARAPVQFWSGWPPLSASTSSQDAQPVLGGRGWSSDTETSRLPQTAGPCRSAAVRRRGRCRRRRCAGRPARSGGGLPR